MAAHEFLYPRKTGAALCGIYCSTRTLATSSAPRGPYSNELTLRRLARRLHVDKSGENAECTDGGGSPGSDVLPRPGLI